LRIGFGGSLLGLLLVLLNSLAWGGAGAPTTTQDFQTANRLYEEGKFQEATQAYQKLVADGVRAPALFYNLGNAWVKTGQVGKAIAAYRAAQELAPRDPDILANLQFARARVQGPTLLPAAWERWVRTCTLNEWTAMASGSLWLLMGLLALGEFRPSMKRKVRAVTLASLAVVLVTGACLAANLALSGSDASGVVVVSECPVRLGPLDESPVSFRLRDGAEVKVVDRRDNWVQVATGARRVGWAQLNEITLLR
jgi:hypothetical protein